jgi:uracil-DNA glycosylase
MQDDQPLIDAPAIPASWKDDLSDSIASESYQRLKLFLKNERSTHTVFPPAEDTYAALKLTPLKKVRAVILGQDPYHDDGQAHGLSFSVRHEHRLPPSLRNIVKELHDDLDERIDVTHGDLSEWARQGVLLLNTVLTVRAHQPNSHRGAGWETFTDDVIRAVSSRSSPAVFVFWGAAAAKKESLIDSTRHAIIASPHPSPLSAHRGFFGSKPFSKINAHLRDWGADPIDWYRPWR